MAVILLVSENQANTTEYDTSFKAYMDYRTITDQGSDQWAIQQRAYTDEDGLRKVGEMYCVAVGSYYAESCGKELLIQLDDKTEFRAIVSDLKQDDHTDETNRFTQLKTDGNIVTNEHNIPMINVIEFIVDTDKLSDEIKLSGSVSAIGFEGNIIMITEVLPEDECDKNPDFVDKDK